MQCNILLSMIHATANNVLREPTVINSTNPTELCPHQQLSPDNFAK